MNRPIALAIGGALLIGVTGVLIATVEQDNGIVLIAGDKPVTEDQVRQKMRAEGWSNVQIEREGRTTQPDRRRFTDGSASDRRRRRSVASADAVPTSTDRNIPSWCFSPKPPVQTPSG
jgi:hypothetical protein